ncbi:MAG: peptide-methionine (S)-S-oxide reductase MsrA [Wenyingzhuangia sp.]|uniref:peptide-methionine (S)-S-oxide reductase MsrA n=1 Tax=Wenyingzhuangia sp. TaxID=1964193 RepID=UPI00321BACCA
MRIILFILALNMSLYAQNKNGPTASNLKIAYVASGCFWCVEAIYESVPGVTEAISGYAGSDVKNPTYNTIKDTGHAETVAIYYDAHKISFSELIDIYYLSQNPTTYGQHPDFGKNYRSIIFYNNTREKEIATLKFNQINQTLDGKAITEIRALDHFYPAEDYHQNYEKNHPENPYVQQVSIPRLNRFKAKYFKN